MRIIAQDTESYIKALASCIGKDPASLESWRCIHLAFAEAEALPPTAALMQSLKSEFKNADCDVVLCNDQDILILGHESDIPNMHQMQGYLLQDMADGNRPEARIYDLFYSWREIRKLLLSKVSESAALTLPDDTADFGEVDALSEVFNAAKRVRNARNPLHLLLVEDDDMTRRLVSGLFKEQYALFTATNAEEALASYLLHAPDIVFLDINLPDHNGFQVLKQILDNDPDAYVVMFSGNSYLENVTHALNAGASGFIAKPFSREKMRHYIEDCALGRHSS